MTVTDPASNGASAMPTTLGARSSSYQRIDLLAVDSSEAPTPSILHRSDGEALLYKENTHLVYGEPGVGKSWLALLACAAELSKGNEVVFFDYESTAKIAKHRLSALGVTEQELMRFVYVRPWDAFTMEDAAWVTEMLAWHQPTLAVLDGVTKALAYNGWDPLSNTDVARFYR